MSLNALWRTYEEMYNDPKWLAGRASGIALTIQAVTECLTGDEMKISDRGIPLPPPKYGAPEINELLDQLRAFKDSLALNCVEKEGINS